MSALSDFTTYQPTPISSQQLQALPYSQLKRMAQEARQAVKGITEESTKLLPREVKALRREAFPKGLYAALASATPFGLSDTGEYDRKLYNYWNELKASYTYQDKTQIRAVTLLHEPESPPVLCFLKYFIPAPWELESKWPGDSVFSWQPHTKGRVYIACEMLDDWRALFLDACYYASKCAEDSFQFARIDDLRFAKRKRKYHKNKRKFSVPLRISKRRNGEIKAWLRRFTRNWVVLIKQTVTGQRRSDLAFSVHMADTVWCTMKEALPELAHHHHKYLMDNKIY